ncbi:hypothetical protein B0T17DRAFT_507147 [Bombardia bombarda]|uniref:Uncharacterized protein n=1 Tax=Bombardia bombarda TaxID=252184 RepID=A0AA39XC31_9PEZI|nr:hypothetical protein B0T17DRAFT_507147 [Bombardia bombarda]
MTAGKYGDDRRQVQATVLEDVTTLGKEQRVDKSSKKSSPSKVNGPVAEGDFQRLKGQGSEGTGHQEHPPQDTCLSSLLVRLRLRSYCSPDGSTAVVGGCRKARIRSNAAWPTRCPASTPSTTVCCVRVSVCAVDIGCYRLSVLGRASWKTRAVVEATCLTEAGLDYIRAPAVSATDLLFRRGDLPGSKQQSGQCCWDPWDASPATKCSFSQIWHLASGIFLPLRMEVLEFS